RRRCDELPPKAGLDAEDACGLFRREAIRHRFPRQHFGDRLRAALIPFPWRARLARAFLKGEVELVGRGNHEVMTFVCGSREHVGPVSAPPLDDDTLWGVGFHLLVPCHRPLAETLNDPNDLASEISLYVLIRLQTLLGLAPVSV